MNARWARAAKRLGRSGHKAGAKLDRLGQKYEPTWPRDANGMDRPCPCP